MLEPFNEPLATWENASTYCFVGLPNAYSCLLGVIY